MESINVEQIMQEIREDIKKKGYSDEMLSFRDVQTRDINFEEYDKRDYQAVIHDLEVYSYVPWYRELPQSGVKKIFKKVIRKVCAFLIAPVTEQQSDFNAETVKGFEQIAGFINQYEQTIEMWKNNVELLERRVVQLEDEVKKLKEETKSL